MKELKNLRIAFLGLLIVGLISTPATSQARRPSHPPAPSPSPSPSPRIAAAGSWTDCTTITDTRPVGSSSFLTVSVTQTFTGTFNGVLNATEYEFVHTDGSAVFYGSGVFTGTVAGKTGTFKMNYIGTANSDDSFTAHWVIHDGTGQLTNLFGEGTFNGSAAAATGACASPFAGSYNGQVWFAGSFGHH